MSLPLHFLRPAAQGFAAGLLLAIAGCGVLLRLQNTGQTQAADELLKTLHKRFPDENLTAGLKALKKN